MVRIMDNSAKAFAAIRRGALLGLQAGLLLIETDAKLYAPVLTGNHRRSIASKVVDDGGTNIAGIVGHQSDYGSYLENGTRHMAARPHFRPAFDKNEATAQRLIVEYAGREMAATMPKAGI